MAIASTLSCLVMTMTMHFCYLCFVFINTLVNVQSQLCQVMLKLLHTSNILIIECQAELEIFNERVVIFFFIFIFSHAYPNTCYKQVLNKCLLSQLMAQVLHCLLWA